MTEAEILHRRKLQLKNEVVRPLLSLMHSGLDVPGILQAIAEQASAGKGIKKGSLDKYMGISKDKKERE
jgi:hypothetical protein